MTVSSTNTKRQFNGDGSTAAFAYNFKVFADADLQVIVRSSTGTESVKTSGSHYNASGIGETSGGTVTFTSGNIPASGETITLRRAKTVAQELDLVANDPFPAANLENQLDKLTHLILQNNEELDRALKLSRTNTMTSTEFTTSATDRANKLLSFDSGGEISVTQELGVNRGNWAASTSYNQRDLIKDTSTSGNNSIYFVNTAHTSSGSLPISTNTDAAKFDLLVDLTGSASIAGVTAGTVAADKTVVVDSNKDIASFRNLTATGTITAGTFVLGTASLNENDLESIDGITAGTVAASKAAIVDSSKNITGFNNVTLTGELDAATLDISGDANIAGEVQTTKIAFTDGDDAMTITNTGLVEFNTGFNVGSDAAGDILYNNGSKYVRLAKGSDGQALVLASGVPAWATNAGDIAGVTAGTGLSGGGTSGTVTVNVDAAQTGITSVINTSLAVGRDADNQIQFSTDDFITFRVDGSTRLNLISSALSPSGTIDLGSNSAKFQNIFLSGEVDAQDLDLSRNAVIDNNVTIGGKLIMPDVTSGKILVGDGTSYEEVAVSGDVTIASNGAVTIAAGSVENSMLADDAVGADELAANAVVNASVASDAAIVDTKLATISTANKVALTALDIDGGTDIGADIADADLFIIDDNAGGTNKKVAASRIKTYISASSTAADDIGTGDAAVTIATSSGNITLDAQGNNTDIIFKGTDGGADTTFLTLSGANAGAASFNGVVTANAGVVVDNITIDGNTIISTDTNGDINLTPNGTGKVNITSESTTNTLQLTSTNNSTPTAPDLIFYRNSSTPADGDFLARIDAVGRNDNSQDVEYFSIQTSAQDVSDGSEDCSVEFYTMTAGTKRNRFTIYPSSTVFNQDSVDVDFRVESNGNANMLFVDGGNDAVGIGNNNPADYGSLIDNLVIGTTSGENGMTIVSGTSNGGRICFADNTSSPQRGMIEYAHSDDSMRFNANGATRINIGSGGDIDVETGDIFFSTAGKGIVLGATSNTAANTLDDYEEGTWDPTLGGNASYSIQSGTYVKVGRIVFAQGVLSVSTLGTGSTGTISGLPFASINSGGGNMGGGIFYFAGLAVNVISPQTYLGNNLTTLLIKSRTAAGTDLNASLAVFGNSARVDFSLTYETAS